MTTDAFDEHPPKDAPDFITQGGYQPAPRAGAAPPPPKGRDKPQEAVDHPAHYGGADDPFETIKVLRAWLPTEEFRGFLRGNVIKYQSRLGKKAARSQDAAKAAWYAQALADFEAEIDRPDRKVAP